MGSAFSTATARRRARTVPSSQPQALTWGHPGTQGTQRATPSLMPGRKVLMGVGGLQWGPGMGCPANGDPGTRGPDVLREGPPSARARQAQESEQGVCAGPRVGSGGVGVEEEGSSQPHPDPPSPQCLTPCPGFEAHVHRQQHPDSHLQWVTPCLPHSCEGTPGHPNLNWTTESTGNILTGSPLAPCRMGHGGTAQAPPPIHRHPWVFKLTAIPSDISSAVQNVTPWHTHRVRLTDMW